MDGKEIEFAPNEKFTLHVTKYVSSLEKPPAPNVFNNLFVKNFPVNPEEGGEFSVD